MLREVQIGGQAFCLASNGATPIRYKAVFGTDLMSELNQITNGKKDEGEALEIISKLAFVMYTQATADKSIWKSITTDSYIEFLEQFEAMDLTTASAEIMNIYLNQASGDSKPKKEEGQ